MAATAIKLNLAYKFMEEYHWHGYGGFFRRPLRKLLVYLLVSQSVQPGRQAGIPALV
jgi:hypothetical protein